MEAAQAELLAGVKQWLGQYLDIVRKLLRADLGLIAQGGSVFFFFNVVDAQLWAWASPGRTRRRTTQAQDVKVKHAQSNHSTHNPQACAPGGATMGSTTPWRRSSSCWRPMGLCSESTSK